MSPVSTLFFVLGHLGQIKQDLLDVEQVGADILSGKLSRADAKMLLDDLVASAEAGLLDGAGIDKDELVAYLKDAEAIVLDAVDEVSAVKAGGVQAGEVGAKKLLADFDQLIADGKVTKFGDYNREQVRDVIKNVISAL